MMTSTCVRDDGGFSGGHVYGNLGTLDEVDAPVGEARVCVSEWVFRPWAMCSI